MTDKRLKLTLTDAQILAMTLDGKTLREIAETGGVSRQRIRQIVHKMQLGKAPARVIRRARQSEEKDQVRDAAYKKRWGHNRAAHRKLRLIGVHSANERGPVRAYSRQRQNAAKREIQWRFTLAQWWAMWKKSGKWPERGRGRGKYVMVRRNAYGPYSVSNCTIVLFEEAGKWTRS